MESLWNIAATGLFLAAAGALFCRWLAACGAALPAPFSDPLPRRAGDRPTARACWRVFFLALLFRCGVAAASLLLYDMLTGVGAGLGELPELWTRWDGVHYIHLVEEGYGGYLEDGKPLFLVFFPLYVWIVRAARLVIPDTALAGMVVSALAYSWGCVWFYRLSCEEYGSRTAERGLILLAAYPFSFFFGGIMTESLFFLTTTAGLYAIRQHRWEQAAAWGFLAAMTRMQGVLLIGAAVAELCEDRRPLAERGRAHLGALAGIGKKLPLLCVPVLGSLVYLGLNQYVAGDPFAFTVMQQHWSQGFQWFPEVLVYLVKNALTWPRVPTRWEMWIPEVVLFPVFALLLWRSWKRHRGMFTLYGFVYLILNYCLSWLLSAGRYLSCGVPFFLFAADELEGKPWVTAGVAAGMGLLQCAFLFRYLCWGQVM